MYHLFFFSTHDNNLHSSIIQLEISNKNLQSEYTFKISTQLWQVLPFSQVSTVLIQSQICVTNLQSSFVQYLKVNKMCTSQFF